MKRTSNVAPLGHWLRDQLHVLELLEILQHRRLAGADVSLNTDHKRSTRSVFIIAIAYSLHNVAGEESVNIKN